MPREAESFADEIERLESNGRPIEEIQRPSLPIWKAGCRPACQMARIAGVRRTETIVSRPHPMVTIWQMLLANWVRVLGLTDFRASPSRSFPASTG